MMTINRIILAKILIMCSVMGYAQNFINKGVITYERKVQIHKVLEGNSWAKNNIESFPKFYVSTFDLKFNHDTSIYTKTSEDDQKSGSWAVYSKDNEIITFFAFEQNIVKRAIYSDVYTVKDSLPKINWKLVNETRMIAGIECKKATAIINDSIFVVAFYSERIQISGGPEQFNGLPGMILGVVVPRLHVSYYAQKVTSMENQTTPMPKQKKQSMTRKEFEEMVMKNMKWAFTNSGIGVLYLFL